MAMRWLALLLAACSACAVTPHLVRPPVADLEVHRFELRWSNVYLLRRGGAAILIDSGSPADRERLVAALARVGVKPSDIRAVIQTHGHADHAGLAAFFQSAGARIVLGAGDVAMAGRGHNDPLDSQSVTAFFIKPLIDFPYTAFKPDIAVSDRLDLAELGFDGLSVEAMPGHTPGSLVVFAPGGDVFAGDVMAGGWFGGTLFGADAGEHFYQADAERNDRNIRAILDRGAKRIFLGHGGPVSAASAERYLAPARVALGVGADSMHGRGVGSGLEIGTHNVIALGTGFALGRGYDRDSLVPGVALGFRRFGGGYYLGPSVGVNRDLDRDLWSGSLLLDTGYRFALGRNWSLRVGASAGALVEEETGWHLAAMATLAVGVRLHGADFPSRD